MAKYTKCMRYSEGIREIIKTMREEGLSNTEISKQLSISPKSIYNIEREYSISDDYLEVRQQVKINSLSDKDWEKLGKLKKMLKK